MKILITAVSLVLMAMCALMLGTKFAKADVIYVNGKPEQAKCESLKGEPVEIVCRSLLHVCTYYPETDQYECHERCFDE